MRAYLFVGAVAFVCSTFHCVSGSLLGQEGPYSFKGNPLGMTLQEFKKQNFQGYVYYDKKGNELTHQGSSMSFDAPPGSPPTGLIDHPLNFSYDVAPDPKALRARVVVRVEASGRMGTADLDLTNAAAIAQSAPPVSNTPASPAPAPTPQIP